MLVCSSCKEHKPEAPQLYTHDKLNPPSWSLGFLPTDPPCLFILYSEIFLKLEIYIKVLPSSTNFITLFHFQQFQRCWAVFQNNSKIYNFLCTPLCSHCHWSTAHYVPMGTQTYPPAFVSCYSYCGTFARSERIQEVTSASLRPLSISETTEQSSYCI